MFEAGSLWRLACVLISGWAFADWGQRCPGRQVSAPVGNKLPWCQWDGPVAGIDARDRIRACAPQRDQLNRARHHGTVQLRRQKPPYRDVRGRRLSGTRVLEGSRADANVPLATLPIPKASRRSDDPPPSEQRQSPAVERALLGSRKIRQERGSTIRPAEPSPTHPWPSPDRHSQRGRVSAGAPPAPRSARQSPRRSGGLADAGSAPRPSNRKAVTRLASCRGIPCTAGLWAMKLRVGCARAVDPRRR